MTDKEAGPAKDIEWVDVLYLHGKPILTGLLPGDRKDLLEALSPITRKAALCERMADKLSLILPMAKGYAAEHPVGSNQKYVESAEEAKADYDKEARG